MGESSKDENDPFDGADYYDCTGSEILVHGVVADAITEHVDNAYEPGVPVAEIIKRLSPIAVRAYRKAAIGPAQIDRWTNQMIDHLDEMISEEDALCDPESGDTGVTRSVAHSVRVKLRPLVEEYAADVDVWHCDLDGERTYSAEEVEAICRKMHPHWFDKGGTPL